MIAVEKDNIFIEAQNNVLFEQLTQEFDTLLDYISQEGPTINPLSITIQSEHGIITD